MSNVTAVELLDGNGPTAQGRRVPHFHRTVKRVDIQVQYDPFLTEDRRGPFSRLLGHRLLWDWV